ncbi:PREDICTED: putative fatty acyl-CoA reductase CG5065 [Drosophila arizonae]|uniref:Fatty acyl-CoA reductase n=1 Tax=Drosophila arizonae TaxID=7263 RepID=A0ABM1P0T7_DROAR|nr:PREDICTED: putative fatty acyl-CoA reductase CG5065 [Drosophila arizonae]
MYQSNTVSILNEEYSNIRKFFNKSNIFITGGTGFLGKILINKLLASCPALNTIYLLVRTKNNESVDARLDEMFADPVFESLKQVSTKYTLHLKAIAGDCLKPGLGLNSNDRQLLIDHVDVVFHMAATVRFDEKLKSAVKINVHGTYDIMQLCKEMKKLKSVVHVSTAYTHCPRRTIEEKLYSTQNNPKSLMLMAEYIPDKLLDYVTSILLGKWPNTYTFTKAVAEDVIRVYTGILPVGVFRPGIVISTYQEPVSGWIDNFYGPTGAIAGAGTGLIRTLQCNPKALANMVPVDFCVNSMIAASWDIYERHNAKKFLADIPVYNFCTPNENQLTWGEFTTKNTKYGLMYPTSKAIWYLCYSNATNKVSHMLSICFLHYLPALFIDFLCLCIGKEPRLLNTYKKIHKFINVISHFSTRDWDFHIDNVQSLWSRMSSIDKTEFFFDMRQLDWDFYLQQYFRGIRKYLLKDPLETIPKALVKWNRLYWQHQILKAIIYLILMIIVWTFLKN